MVNAAAGYVDMIQNDGRKLRSNETRLHVWPSGGSEISTFRLADVPVALRTIGEIAGTSQIAGTAAADFEHLSKR